jgi:IS30 family transposase
MGSHYAQLAPEERGVIMTMTAQGLDGASIARLLGRAASSITRELHRNGFRLAAECGPMGRPRIAGGYDALRAGQRARRLRRQPRVVRKLATGSPLWATVSALLTQGWSPQQVAGRLRRAHPTEPALQVSHETIYTAIYAAPRGELRRGLIALLRQHKCARRSHGQKTNRRGRLPDLPSIHLRPPEAAERLVPGHWEGDLIRGTRNGSAVGTLVDRHSLFVMLVKMDDATAQSALTGFSRAFAPVPPELRKTLTYDQGKEMALHAALAAGTGLSIYFADPHSPWQRGICENINGLLRQYLPKTADLSVYSQRELDQIAWRLNTRPRKTLSFQMPAEVFFEHCYKQRYSGSSDA